jgi:serine protease inhibitor ecotin
MREYKLQEAVKAAGGVAVMRDDGQRHRQYRVVETTGKETQMVSVDDHQCELALATWQEIKADVLECMRCEKRLMGGEAKKNLLATWGCAQHEFDICLSCIPVVIKTPDPPDKTKRTL